MRLGQPVAAATQGVVRGSLVSTRKWPSSLQPRPSHRGVTTRASSASAARRPAGSPRANVTADDGGLCDDDARRLKGFGEIFWNSNCRTGSHFTNARAMHRCARRQTVIRDARGNDFRNGPARNRGTPAAAEMDQNQERDAERMATMSARARMLFEEQQGQCTAGPSRGSLARR